MKTIKTYIDNTFSTLPATPDVLALKKDMTAHMEDKYEALLSEGKSNNEAIGIVISEFGDIAELAAEMGITLPESNHAEVAVVDTPVVDAYLAAAKKNSRFAAVGIFLVLLGAALLITLSSLLANGVVGVVILLFFIAVAVGLFIYGGSLVEPYKYIETGKFTLTHGAKAFLETTQNSLTSGKTIGEIVGITLILLGVMALLVFALFGNYLMAAAGVALLLVCIGIGTGVMVLSGSASQGYNKLLKRGEYAPEARKKDGIIGVVAAIFWPLAVAIYLAYSFLGPTGFSKSWVIFPIAGVIFAVIAIIISVVMDSKKAQ